MLSFTAALAPVLCLLTLLVLMDSFKLVPLRFVAGAVAAGALAAVVALGVNTALIDLARVPLPMVTRLFAPFLEELLKLGVVAYTIHRRRVGFPVDAAIVGFAIGTGFAVTENAYYLIALQTTDPAVWLIRGFGSAILHAATTGIAAILAQSLAARRPGQGLAVFVPGALAAIATHLVYNQFVLPPLAATLILLAVLPPLVLVIFDRSERATREWMSAGLDLDVELHGLMLSEDFGQTRLGTYLQELKARFPGPVVADMFCLMRVELELGIRAKGLLMARDAGIEMPLDDDVAAALAEVRYLEKAIGPTALLALSPLQVSTERDAWHRVLLEEQSRGRRAV